MSQHLPPPSTVAPPAAPWWKEVTRYQWMVLAIASAGWVFDVFEGQLVVSLRQELLAGLVPVDGREVGSANFIAQSLAAPALAPAGSPLGAVTHHVASLGVMEADRLTLGREAEQARATIFDLGVAAFLAGGALGGVVFGSMADRWGRRRTMAFTILMYSLFTGLTALVQNGWQLAVLRFLVGMGVGGEWAVAAAAVAEVFPPRARPAASGIFHASSVLGTWLAIGAALIVLAIDSQMGWRYGFLLGVLPALLVAWVRVGMHEPESWQAARQAAAHDRGQRLGRVADLFTDPTRRRNTLLATGLAIIGLATFWGAHIRGKDVLDTAYKAAYKEPLQEGSAPLSAKGMEMLGMFLATTGGGLGLLAFAPISQRVGRRPAFVLYHLGAFALVAVVFLLYDSPWPLLAVLPVFGFFTLGMHAGYAVYFPELFPTRLRGTGAGFCFNVARVLAGPVLLGFGRLRGQLGPAEVALPRAMLLLGTLFLIGALVSLMLPETRGRPLPE